MPQFKLVEIIPNVTGWASAYGPDVIQLKAGERIAVPEHLAKHLCAAGRAELAA